MQRLTVGDDIAGAGSWGSSVRFAGISFSKDFALRPDLVTTPLLSATGNTVVPSTVDIFLNNQLISSQSLAPGPFIAERLPAISGAGDVRIIVRDTLGREQVFSQEFYSSPQLLAKDLSQYSFSLGSVRRRYATRSNLYGSLLASVTYRRGLSNHLTIEGHGEFLASQAGAVGATLVGNMRDIAAVDLTLAYGGKSGAGGGLLALGMGRQSQRWSWAASRSYAQADYVQVSSAIDSSFQFKTRDLLNLGFQLGRSGGSLALAYARQTYRVGTNEKSFSFTGGRNLGRRTTAQLIATRQVVARDKNLGIFLNISYVPQVSRTVLTSFTGGTGASAPDTEIYSSITNAAPVGEGQGSKLGASTRGRVDGLWRLQTAQGDAQLSGSRFGGTTGLRAEWSGGATLVEKQFRSARRIDNSFAMVNVGGLENVGIYVENHLATRTDATGWAILHDLRPYEANRISVNADELPLDTTIGSNELVLAPSFRKGVVARFDIAKVTAATVQLVLEDGTSLPAGALLRLNEMEFPVAYGGVAYLTDIGTTVTGEVAWDGKRCRFTSPVPQGIDPLPDLGRVTCVMQPLAN
jgi:outer membrane usher protein